MKTSHVCFADMPLAVVNRDGRSHLDALNDDTIRQCRSVSPNNSISPTPRYERNMGFFRQLSRRFGLRSNDDLVFTSCNEDDNQSSSTDSYSSHTPAAATITATTLFAGDSARRDNNQLLATVQGTEYISCGSSDTSSTVDIEEQLLQLQQQHQYNTSVSNDEDDVDNAEDDVDDDATAVDTTENASDAAAVGYDKQRKSFARSSLSRLHRRSTSSLRRAFQSFSLSSRSLSCSGVTPPPISATSASTNNGTPIKSALKFSSNLELNKRTQCSILRKSSSSAHSCPTTSANNKPKPPPQRILRQPVSYTYLKGISGLPTQRVPRNSVCCQYSRR